MAGVDLHFSEQGSGPPLVILHGLFGSSRNWTSIARELALVSHVFALDLRNHGDSPRTPDHTLGSLAEDLLLFLQKVGTPTVVLGHSMGGLAAMHAALERPEALRGLIVVDIAPRSYAPRHHQEFKALREDLSGLRSRQEVDARMALHLADPVIRQFLQMNLIRGTDDRFSWKLPIDTLERASFIEGFEPQGKFDGPALFIAGGKSDYVQQADHAVILERFPNAAIEILPDAGHWPHYSHPAAFLRLVTEFLRSLP